MRGTIPRQYRPIQHDHAGSMEWVPNHNRATECYCRDCGQAWELKVIEKADGTKTYRWNPVDPGAGERFDPWANDDTF